MTVETLRRVDARGLACPMPIIRTARAIAEMESGELLEVLATDPGSTKDFVAWSRTTGHELLEQSVEDGVYRFLLRRK
jgi:tRNA 2-thiouridine synthesizing protein A